MSDPADHPSPDDVPTVRLSPDAEAAHNGLAAGSSLLAGGSAGWGRWTFPAPNELSGQFNGYEVEALLGQGGMGAVYRARQQVLDRTVAIKVLPQELSADPGFAARFHREAKVMARLDHPNIVRVFEFGKTSAGLLYFTMEYIGGGDLKRLLAANGRLPASRAARVMLDVCAALECAHHAGTIHRDIKPANILLTADGRAKVADFGLVRMTDVESDVSTTGAGAVMGTPDFMAPEQRDGGQVGPAADVFAAGVVFYQLLTGRLPHGAWEVPSVVGRDRGLDIDVRLDAIVTQALQDDPAARFSDGGAMRKAIDEVVPVAAAQPSPRRGPSGWAMATAALVLAGVAGLLVKTPLWPRLDDRVMAAAVNLAAPVDRAAVDRVILLDISRLRPEDTVVAKESRKITPRDKLLALVRGIAAERPQAIAIDIDFGPSVEAPHESYARDDPEFLRALLKLKHESGVPVFVGVYRQANAGQAGWLASAEFAPLAAGIGIATSDRGVVERLPLELISASDGVPLPSLSTAMARAAGTRDPSNGWAFAWMTRLSQIDEPSATEYIPNFSPLDRLAWQRLSGIDPGDVPGLRERLQRNLVILSDAEFGTGDGDDKFAVPTRGSLPVPGAYIHACGLVTLLSGAPARLTRGGRMLAGLLFVSALAVGFWLVERWVRGKSDTRSLGTARTIGRCLAAGAVALVAFVFMRSWRVAWPDLFYLCVGLLLLRPLSIALDAAVRRLIARRQKRA